MKIPKPENPWVVLWSDALRRPTRHHYARTDELEEPDDFDSEGRWRRTFAFVYRCAETGEARRFGMESTRLRARVLPKKATRAPAPPLEMTP